MEPLREAHTPFQFCTRLHLSELTGLRAATLLQLVDGIKKAPGASIYHHTHRFLQEQHYLTPEPPNDFALWVEDVLGESELGEALASIDTMSYSSVRQLREAIVIMLEAYLAENAFAGLKFARRNEEFHFIKSVSMVVPVPLVARTLREFVEILRKVSLASVYYHVFEARLRLEKPTNDFSSWLEHELGEKKLADRIAGLDPYTRTLDDLRGAIIAMAEKRMAETP